MPTTLAIAEPGSPNSPTRTGMRIAPGMTPASVYHRGLRVFCTPRSQPLPAMMMRVSGMAIDSMRIHSAAAAAISGSPVSHSPMRPASVNTIAASVSPTPSPTHVAWTPSATASARRPEP